MAVSVSWRVFAACKEADTELFFGSGDTESQKDRLDREEKAKAICADCSVREECLHEALVHREEGVWGGLTKYERKRLLRKRSVIESPEGEMVLRRIVMKPAVDPMVRVIEVRAGWDGDDVLIRTEQFGGEFHGMKWIVEKNGVKLYETSDETDAWSDQANVG